MLYRSGNEVQAMIGKLAHLASVLLNVTVHAHMIAAIELGEFNQQSAVAYFTEDEGLMRWRVCAGYLRGDDQGGCAARAFEYAANQARKRKGQHRNNPAGSRRRRVASRSRDADRARTREEGGRKGARNAPEGLALARVRPRAKRIRSGKRNAMAQPCTRRCGPCPPREGCGLLRGSLSRLGERFRR